MALALLNSKEKETMIFEVKNTQQNILIKTYNSANSSIVKNNNTMEDFQTLKNNVECKENLLKDLFSLLNKTNYSVLENFDYGFNKVYEINLIIEKDNFKFYKNLIKNHLTTKNIFYSKTETECNILIYFKDGTECTLNFVWALNSKIDYLFNFEEALNTSVAKNGYKIFNNYLLAKFIGLNHIQSNTKIPNRFKKYGIVLKSSQNEIDKLLYSLFFKTKEQKTDLNFSTFNIE